MKFTSKTVLLWLLFSIVCLLALGLSIFIWLAEGNELNPITIASTIIFALVPVAFMGIGGLIVSRIPRHAVGRLAMLLSILIILSGLAEFTFSSYPQVTLDPPLVLYAAAWYGPMSYMVIMIIIMFIALLFPTGKPPSPRWRWLLRYGLFLLLIMVVLSILADGWRIYGEGGTGWTLENPFGLIPVSSLETSLAPPLLFGILAVFCFFSLIVRYRHGGYVERQQIKWLLLACALFVLMALLLTFGGGSWEELDGLRQDLYSLFFALGVISFPIAIGITILRYQLFDIDIIIRKSLVYTVLTILLALVYFGLVILLQNVFDSLSGQQSPIAIVISTLVIAALFAPLRRRVQDFIDRRFFRKKYDAQQVLAQFTQTAQDETDMEALTAELIRVVQDTIQPDEVSLWLKDHSL